MSVGSRLKEERLRLGMSQPAFAALANVTKGALVKWEKDTASPNALALNAFADAGADAVYILTGMRTIDRPLSSDDNAKLLLDEVQEILTTPSRWRQPNETEEQTEERCLRDARKILKSVINDYVPHGLSDELLSQAQSLKDATESKAKLISLRAAVLAQRHKQEEDTRIGLEIYLKRSAYQPNDAVLNRLVQLSIDFGVHYEPLIELLREVHRDIVSGTN